MEENIFWMCFVENGQAPAFRHQNEETAIAEAKRLCDTLKKKVWVLKSELLVKVKDKFDVIRLEETEKSKDDLPF